MSFRCLLLLPPSDFRAGTADPREAPSHLQPSSATETPGGTWVGLHPGGVPGPGGVVRTAACSALLGWSAFTVVTPVAVQVGTPVAVPTGPQVDSLLG